MYNFMSYLIKFGDKKWIEKLQNGEIFMQPFKYYRDLELKQMKKGQGDKHEVMLYSTKPGGTIRLVGSNKESQILSFALKHEDDEKYLTCCFYNVDDKRLIIKEPTNSNYKLINFTDDEKKEFSEWGDTALIINKEKFIERLDSYLIPNKIRALANKVFYYNPNNPPENCIKAHTEVLDARFFWKEEFFTNQNEYRIILDQKNDVGKVVASIGNINDISICVRREDILK